MGKTDPFVGIGDVIGLVVGIGPLVGIGLFGGTGLVVSLTDIKWHIMGTSSFILEESYSEQYRPYAALCN